MPSDPSTPTAQSPDSILQQNWWHKPLIWGVFVALIYALREFFLVGFLTFLFCFIVRSLVGAIARRIAPHRPDSHRLDLILTLSIFSCLCLSLYGLGRFFVPPLIHEGKSLVTQMKQTNAVELQNTLLSNTAGTWKFRRQFGPPEDPRYKKGLAQFLAAGRSGAGLYQEFPQLHSRLKAEFEANYEQAQVLQLQSQASGASVPFKTWFMEFKAPDIFHAKQDYYVSRWQASQASDDKQDEAKSLTQKTDFESLRDERIRQRIWADVNADPVLLAQLKSEWAQAISIQKWAEFRESPAYQAEFKQFYETQFADDSNNVPIDYAYFETLAAAYPKGKQAFLEAVDQHQQTAKESAAHQQFDFESATKREFGQQWWATSPAADWVREHATEDGPKILAAGVKQFDQALGHVLRVPIQIGTALLLAVFMLIEWDSVKTGVANIRNTRLRSVFDEIAPGVIALGKLIGKSFQGQVVIAVINAFLTLIALWIIGVEYKFILAMVVFVFSFIPVVGVILSGVPLCGMAILQPGGSLLMAVQVIAAVALIHLIEGMVLSPRIIGKIGHLHPVLVIAILLIAEHFFGMWGLVLGVPVAIYLIRVVLLDLPIPGIYEPDRAPELE
ncbi:AI-2E family transporter [Rosistilla oblonga]|uniref:Pheromone autoinducer 2 transporter n=1 Tax=Rosistilla oblonga TaxID=2527990 RepID=A0A518IMQ7_9BACT|nr:AI-2E family transporter [Rosistilla oblonga]QDV54362.1 pheromone autoinducer 2 transporter [Rosistilla oblonga]